MAFVPLRRTRLNQPRGEGLDPVFCGVESAVVCGGAAFYCGASVVPVVVQTVDYKPTPAGIGSSGNNISAGIFIPGKFRYATPGNLVYVATIVWSGNTTVGKFAGFGHNGSPDLYVEEFATNKNYADSSVPGCFVFKIRDQSGNMLAGSPTTFRLTAGIAATIAISFESSTSLRMFVNGGEVSVTNSGSTSPNKNLFVTKDLALGNFNYGPSTTGRGDATNGTDIVCYRSAFFARLAVSTKMARSLSANPWQVFL